MAKKPKPTDPRQDPETAKLPGAAPKGSSKKVRKQYGDRRQKAAKKALKEYKVNPVATTIPQDLKKAVISAYRTFVPLKPGKSEGGQQLTSNAVEKKEREAKSLEPRLNKLADNDNFMKLMADVSEADVKKLMTFAAVETRLNPTEVNTRSGDTGLFQQHAATFSTAVAKKANKLLASKGIKGANITNINSLTNPVSALAYQLTVGIPKGSVLEAYKQHQQGLGAGTTRRVNIREATDPMELSFSLKELKNYGQTNLVRRHSATLAGARTISDIDDAINAMKDNVAGNTKIKNSRRQVIASIQEKLKKAYPNNRGNIPASVLTKEQFNNIKRALEIYDEDTLESIEAMKKVPKGKMLQKLGYEDKPEPKQKASAPSKPSVKEEYDLRSKEGIKAAGVDLAKPYAKGALSYYEKVKGAFKTMKDKVSGQEEKDKVMGAARAFAREAKKTGDVNLAGKFDQMKKEAEAKRAAEAKKKAAAEARAKAVKRRRRPRRRRRRK